MRFNPTSANEMIRLKKKRSFNAANPRRGYARDSHLALRHAVAEALETRRLLSFYTSTQLPLEVDNSVYDSSLGDRIDLTDITAQGINNNGQVVGNGVDGNNNTQYAFVFSPSTLPARNTAPSITALESTSSDSNAYGIDSNGLVVGNTDSAGFVYPSTGVAPDSSAVTVGDSSLFSAAGQMTGGGDEFAGGEEVINNPGNADDGTQHPVLYDYTANVASGTITSLIDLAPSSDLNSSSFSGAVMGIGSRAVGWINAGQGDRAAIQASDNTTGPLTDISSKFSGSGNSEALGIDSNDFVVGYAPFADSNQLPEPFIYDINGNTVTEIPKLSGMNKGEALAVANVGGDQTVVGWEGNSNTTNSVAFVYDATTGVIHDLNSLTDVDDSNYSAVLTSATGINSNGAIVANWFDSGSGQTLAYVLSPTNNFVSSSYTYDNSGTGAMVIDNGAGTSLQALTMTSSGQDLEAGYATTSETGDIYGGDFVLYRFNADGSKDTSFGDDGRLDEGFNGAGYGVTLDPTNGDFLVAGTYVPTDLEGSTDDWIVAAYTSSGTPAAIFGNDTNNDVNGESNILDLGSESSALRGDSFLAIPGSSAMEAANTPYGIAVDTDGSIYISGTSDQNGDAKFAVAKLVNGGSGYGLDTSFNGTGVVTTQVPGSAGGDDHGGRIVIQPDHKIVVAGDSDQNTAVVRYNDNGTLDTSFGGTGAVTLSEAKTADWNVGLAFQSDGKILVGATTNTTNGDFAVVRLNSNGSLDDGSANDSTPGDQFGSSGGMATANLGGNDDVDEIYVQPGGQIDALGTTVTTNNGNTTTAGAIAAFSSSGAVELTQSFGSSTVSSSLIHPDEGGIASAIYEIFGAPSSHGTINAGLANNQHGSSPASTTVAPSINIDTSRPTATLDSVTSIPDGIAVEVTYADDVGVNLGSIDANDISVTGARTLTSGTPQVIDSNTGRPTVVYDFTDPSGWTAADDGSYTVAINANQVTDVGGQSVGTQTLDPSLLLHSISGTVFNDANANGVQDSGEAGLAGVTVFADVNNTGNPASQPQATTDASGNYSLIGLVSGGNYTISQVLPAGKIETAPTSGGSATVPLAAADVTGINFGQQQTSGLSIAGYVFNDVNGNGIQDAGDAGVAGIVVYADVNGSGNPGGQPQFTTNSAGHYNISGLSPNTTYTVREVLPNGFTQIAPGSNGGISVSIATASIGGENFAVQGAGQASFTGTVIDGLTGAPVAGVVVFIDSNGNGQLDSGEFSTITNSVGAYTFSDLAAGTYNVVEVVPSGQTTATTSLQVTASNGTTIAPSFADVPAGIPAGTAAPNLTGQFITSPPAAVVGGANGKLTLAISNTGTATATGTITVSLFASPTQSLAGATKISDVAVKMNLKAGKTQKVKLNFAYPSGLANGSYAILASIDSGNVILETSKTDNLAASSAVTIAAPFVSLAATVATENLLPTLFSGGVTRGSVRLVITNSGNIVDNGYSVDLMASSQPDTAGTSIVMVSKSTKIKPGKSVVVNVPVKFLPTLAAGTYYLVVQTTDDTGATTLVTGPTQITFQTLS